MGDSLSLADIATALEERERALVVAEEDLRKQRIELAEDKKAYQRLFELPKRSSADRTTFLALALPPKQAATLKTVKSAVLSAILQVGEGDKVFSSVDVIAAMRGVVDFDIERNRPNISSYLNQDMVHEGLLKIVSRASGRRPAEFRLTDAAKVL